MSLRASPQASMLADSRMNAGIQIPWQSYRHCRCENMQHATQVKRARADSLRPSSFQIADCRLQIGRRGTGAHAGSGNSEIRDQRPESGIVKRSCGLRQRRLPSGRSRRMVLSSGDLAYIPVFIAGCQRRFEDGNLRPARAEKPRASSICSVGGTPNHN